MATMGLWITVIIVIFVVGSIFGARVNPREKALGETRDKARKMGLYPRLLPAPAWTNIEKAAENRASMVAYYNVLLPQARLPLMRACVENGMFTVVHGAEKFKDYPVPLKGIYAVDMQANSIGLYWNEEADLHGTQLEQMKTFLMSLADV
ncbi:ammonium transporter [Acinetobacter sp. EC24]|nr:ammonium transporter [Acinetobacter rathckeae]MBF7688465.1 ammonium transporter [Acinetobacter rathckeae]MBF7695549.1 ammonium transporter [Acinetobacter rathckeae]